MQQRTVARLIRANGIGLASGEPVSVILRPAAVDSGILFRRVDLKPAVQVAARLENLRETADGGVFGREGAQVRGGTPLLAALAGLGIDNIQLDVTAPELPLVAGGAGAFAWLVQRAGVREQGAPRRFLRIRRRVRVTDGRRFAQLEPFDGFRVDLAPEDGGQGQSMDFSSVPFLSGEQGAFRDVPVPPAATRGVPGGDAPGRELLLKQRMLVVLGDLSLLGRSLIGRFQGRAAGGSLTRRLVREVLADPNAWEEITFAAPTPSL